MSMKKNRLITTAPYVMLAFIALCLLLTGCLYEPSSVSDNRIQIQQENFSEKLPVSALNKTAIEALARHYRQHGDGPVTLTVFYDPRSKAASAMHASDEVSRLVSAMRSQGVADMDANILPVKDLGGEMNALISYTAYNALAPKDCGVLPGIRDMKAEIDKDYRLGCSVDTAFSKQIARPKDLKDLGALADTSDGRRISNKVEVYRSGIANEPLEGFSASEE